MAAQVYEANSTQRRTTSNDLDRARNLQRERTRRSAATRHEETGDEQHHAATGTANGEDEPARSPRRLVTTWIHAHTDVHQPRPPRVGRVARALVVWRRVR